MSDEAKRHPQTCPRCMSWMHRHVDVLLQRAGWLKCGTCAYCEIHEDYITKGTEQVLDPRVPVPEDP